MTPLRELRIRRILDVMAPSTYTWDVYEHAEFTPILLNTAAEYAWTIVYDKHIGMWGCDDPTTFNRDYVFSAKTLRAVIIYARLQGWIK